jgi:molybdopterin molybdotransferase
MRDFIPDSLRAMGATIHFHRVNIRPGKPLLFATLPGGRFYCGLPGNPVSAAIGFAFFVMPLVRALRGQPPLQPFMATLENGFVKKGDFRQFLKSALWLDASGSLRVRIADGQESFKISPLAAHNAWVVLEETQTQIAPSERVAVVLYGQLNIKQG